MKRAICVTLMVLAVCMGINADISGAWSGTLNLGQMKMRVVFHFTREGDGYRFSMDSPDQGAKGIPGEIAYLAEDSVSVKVGMAKISYAGKVEADSIKGCLSSMGIGSRSTLSAGMWKYPARRHHSRRLTTGPKKCR